MESHCSTSDDRMTVDHAVDIINHVTLWPDWTVKSRSFEKRHENALIVTLEYRARNSDAPLAPRYEQWVKPFAHADFIMQVRPEWTDMHVYATVLSFVLRTLEHEAREFFGIATTDNPVKPFHPHTLYGMDNWDVWERTVRQPYAANVLADQFFGTA